MQKTKRLKQSIEQWTIGYGWHQNREAKLKIVEGAISWSNQQGCVITFNNVLTSK